MELVEITLTPVQRRARLARVAWTDLAAQQRSRGEQVRVLAPGDHLLVHVDGHTTHRGRVLRYDGTGADGAYVIMIGAPVSRRVADRREPVVQDVEVRVVPQQRAPRVELFL